MRITLLNGFVLSFIWVVLFGLSLWYGDYSFNKPGPPPSKKCAKYNLRYQRIMDFPGKEHVHTDGRISRWDLVPEAGNRYLEAVLLPDGETVHNAFFDRSFRR
jgi:hypothetical protein